MKHLPSYYRDKRVSSRLNLWSLERARKHFFCWSYSVDYSTGSCNGQYLRKGYSLTKELNDIIESAR